MGLFDRAKKFLGGHGVKVQLVRIERKSPEEASMPMTDTVIKGNIVVTTEQDCNVLSHQYQFVMTYKNKDGLTEEEILAEDSHDESTHIHGADISWPYDLAAGSEAKDGFNLIMMGNDIPTRIRKLGHPDPAKVISDGTFEFLVRAKADVKGSPFDPKAEAKLNIVT